MDRVQRLLQDLGWPHAALPDDTVLYPGSSRCQLLEWAVAKALGGAAPDDVLACTATGRSDQAAPGTKEERAAQRHHAILKQIGFPCSANQLLGCGDHASRAKFLVHLLTVISVQQQQQQQQQQRLDAGPLATCSDSGAAGHQEARLLEHMCDNIVALRGDGLKLLPAHLTAKLSSDVGTNDHVAVLQQRAAELQQEVAALRRKLDEASVSGGQHGAPGSEAPGAAGGDNSDAAWQQRSAALQSALQAYLAALSKYDAFFTGELSKAALQASDASASRHLADQDSSISSSSSAGPQPLGETAAALLDSYSHLLQLLARVKTAREVHGCLTRCEGPLEGLQPQQLAAIVAHSQQRIASVRQLAQVFEASAAAMQGSRAAVTATRQQP